MESTLALTREDLQKAVGDHGGYGRTISSYSTTALERINEAVREGVSLVYFPGAYEWSWIKPMVSLTLASGANTILLPDDYNWMHGKAIPASASGEAQFALPVTSYGAVYARQSASPDSTGRPQLACEEAIKGTTATHGSRSQLRVWPIADQEYTLQVKYSLIPNALTDANPYVYGGAQHAQTFKAACVACYARNWDDGVTKMEKMQDFQMLLAASIDQDRKRKPSLPGLNIDRSDDLMSDTRFSFSAIDINGVVPGIA